MANDDKAARLKKIEDEMAANVALPLCDTANLVFGEGNINCDVMFIGEAPGVNEDRLRRPFVGRGGALLDDMIRGLGWKREDVYITNIVKRRPPENRDPSPAEIEAYKPYLTRQIAVIEPKLIVTLGRFSMNYFAPEAKITRDHGRPLLVDGRRIFPVYHPAAGLRSTQMMQVLREDFKKIPAVLAGEAPIEMAPAFEAAPVKKKRDKAAQPGLF
ncbi:MAG TPA: uracil-DNA glycosylase [Candidatus Paceibacterota bacterium]|nr:uracil-DNA glycosylase [Candidatus Paceibacterota bacterium]